MTVDGSSDMTDGKMEVDSTSTTPARSIEGWIVMIAGLHEETSEEDLQDKFADFGTIRNLHLNLDRRTGYVKGYALLEYANRAESDTAIAEANGSKLLGQTIEVSYAFLEPPNSASTKSLAREERRRSRSPSR